VKLFEETESCVYVQVGASKVGLQLAAGEPPETNGKLLHNVDERCMVEIRKI